MAANLEPRILELFYIQMLFFFGPGLASLIDVWVANKRAARIKRAGRIKKPSVLDSRWRTLQEKTAAREKREREAEEARTKDAA